MRIETPPIAVPTLAGSKLGTGYTDARATSLVDAFDFTHGARAFTPIAAPYPPAVLRSRPASKEPPDSE